jgi:prolipoprotein diacylglyceryltransferase
VTRSLTDIAKRVEARVTPPPPVILSDWEGRLRWFGVGVLLGILISIVYAAYS